MNSAYFLAICASILLLQLEMAATRATESGPSEALQQSARSMGLDEVGLRELWRSRQPLVIRNQSPTGELITVTYNLSVDGTSNSRRKVTEGTLPARLEDNSHAKPQEDVDYVSDSGPSEALRQSARSMGLDEVGLRELWRSRQPLVIRSQSPTGDLITVTYNLSTDGTSLSRRKVTEGTLPARLEDNSHAKPQEDVEYMPESGPSESLRESARSLGLD
ncbi:uncharacterized protein LOC108092605 [Drosophila ficusphila]|uniref:uncharacterized protein LOC108092605 n=1 Tax=Drosophila ficusphila TaxID=30025 RepID=UPI001C8ABA3D|nr:uncharacterized protein LOC108092605 [Drosophila ficusphila]